MNQLTLEQGSHLFASMVGWAFPMSRSDQDAKLLLTRVISFTAGEDAEPFDAGWPWPAESQEDDVSPEERAALKAQLQTNSAFGQIRTEAGADDS